MSKRLNEIIQRLGYADSPFIKYRSNNYDANTLNLQTTKILNALLPFAAYVANDSPFVMFFEENADEEAKNVLNQKIWNAQVPVAIFCGIADIKVFCGYTIDRKSHLLPSAIDGLLIDDISDDSPFSFWEISNHNFWENHSKAFTGERLNDVLLRNLAFLTDRLKNTHNIEFATKLVLRLIFIRYLVDRGVNLNYTGFSSDIVASRKALLNLLDDKVKLYELLSYLKDRFNGNLFEVEAYELDCIEDAALIDIKDFLSANILSECGQYSLFDLYDFNIIPVELISSIYEILLGEKAKKKDNAFYTPKYLVDYILNRTIDNHIEQSDSCRILDPACGSGVFLVDSYRRMVEKQIRDSTETPYTKDDVLLRSVLTDNIYGIDRNSDAIDVAIFSLYLAVLDYKDPRTLEKFQLPLLKGVNLLCCDFFDEDELACLSGVSFDFIIGNPPWGNNSGKHEKYYLRPENKHLRQFQSKDTCRAFMLRAMDFSEVKKTMCCFVLKSKILYTQNKKSKLFREFLLKNTKIERIVELSSVVDLVFKGAEAPAIVLSYYLCDDNSLEHRFEHTSMKRNEFFRLFNIIAVEKTDVKSVQQKLLTDYDWAWKTLVYGLTGDIDNILQNAKFSTLEDTIRDNNLVEMTGLKYNESNESINKKNSSNIANLKRPFLTGGDVKHFGLKKNIFPEFTRKRVERVRDVSLFKAPYCLTSHGINPKNYTMRSLYSSMDCVFRESIWAIKGSSEQKNILLNIAGLLNSYAYAYFNLMLGSDVGIERRERQKSEILKFPYIYSEKIAILVEQLQSKIAENQQPLVLQHDLSGLIKELNKTVFNEFGLADNEFVDYALNIQIPRITRDRDNDTDAKRKVTTDDFEEYGLYFYDYLSGIYECSKMYIKINLYPKVVNHYSAFEVLILDEKPSKWFSVINDNVDIQKKILAKLTSFKTNELFYELKDILYFEENSFYIIKPSYYRNWHPAIARLDLMEVTNQILSDFDENGGDNQ